MRSVDPHPQWPGYTEHAIEKRITTMDGRPTRSLLLVILANQIDSFVRYIQVCPPTTCARKTDSYAPEQQCASGTWPGAMGCGVRTGMVEGLHDHILGPSNGMHMAARDILAKEMTVLVYRVPCSHSFARCADNSVVSREISENAALSESKSASNPSARAFIYEIIGNRKKWRRMAAIPRLWCRSLRSARDGGYTRAIDARPPGVVCLGLYQEPKTGRTREMPTYEQFGLAFQ